MTAPTDDSKGKCPDCDCDSSQKEFNLGKGDGVERRHLRSELFAENSLRGAAISLCMTVEELEALLRRRDSEKKSDEIKSDKSLSSSELETKVMSLRAEVAYLRSENHRLQNEVSSLDTALSKYKNAFVIRF